MSDPEDGPPNIPPAPRVPQDDVATNPEASPSPSTIPAPSVPPPDGAEYFDRAYRELLRVHRQQRQNFAELHDEQGPIQRIFQQIDLVLFEVRQLSGQFQGIGERLLMVEKRLDDQDKRLRRLEGLGTGGSPTPPSPATTP